MRPRLLNLDVRFVSIVSRLGPDTLYLIVSRARFIEFRQLCILNAAAMGYGPGGTRRRWGLRVARLWLRALLTYEIHMYPDPFGAVVHLRVAVGSAVGRI